MSVLTWRDVSTPNLGPASTGIANATDAMNRAFASAAGTIDTFKDQRANVADRNIINRSIQYQNPNDLASALGDGSIVGQDGQYAHTGVIAGLRSQVTDLLANAATQTQTDQGKANIDSIKAGTARQLFSNAEAVDHKANIDANAPLITQAQLLAANKDYAGATAVLKQSTLKPEEQQSVLAGLNTNTVNADSIAKDQFNQAKAVKDQQDSLAADAAYKTITSTAPNAAVARGQMLDAGKGMNAEAYSGLVARMKTQYPDIEGSPIKDLNLTTDPVPGGGVSDLSQYTRKYGDNSFSYGKDGFDPTAHSIADVQGYQKNVMIKANRGTLGKDVPADKGSGAIGAYQQTYETIQRLAPKVFPGQDLSTIQFTPQVQEKLAEAQFNEVKAQGGDLKAIWPSLTVQEATQLKGMSWDQAAPYISAGESGNKTAAGVTLAMRNRVKAYDVSSILNKTVADQSANGFIKDYDAAASDSENAANPGAVAVKLMGTRAPELGKADVGNLTYYISDIMKKANVTAPVAGAIVANSLEKASWTGDLFERHLNNDGITSAKLGGGFEINRTVLANMMKLANAPETKQASAGLNYAKETQKTLDDAQTRFTAAQTELVKVAQAQRGDPNNPQLNGALAQATKVFQDAYQAVNGIQNQTLNVASLKQAAAAKAAAEKDAAGKKAAESDAARLKTQAYLDAVTVY